MAPTTNRPQSVSRGGLLAMLSGIALAILTGSIGAPLIATSRAATREPLQMSIGERQHLLGGMRVFLESVEGITRGLAENKMQLVAKSAKRSGWGMMDPAAAATALKLPPEFVAISIDTHQKFDDLSAEASGGTTKAQVLNRLGDILANCTSCHSMYRIGAR